MTDTVVRPAPPADAPGIATVHVASWRAAYPGIVSQAFLDGLSVERRATFWTGVLANPGESITWVAERDGAIVGFLGFAPPGDEDRAALPDGTLDLTTIYLDPAVWRRGIGRRLLERATDDLASRGVPHLMLWVFEANAPARRFYESAGWRADGATQDLAIGDQAIPIVRYQVALEPG